MARRQDNLARPANPAASTHLVPPSPRYCVRSVFGALYMIPYIYDYGFDEFLKAWRKEHGVWSSPTRKELPAYAVPVDLGMLTFEKPVEVPRDA